MGRGKKLQVNWSEIDWHNLTVNRVAKQLKCSVACVAFHRAKLKIGRKKNVRTEEEMKLWKEQKAREEFVRRRKRAGIPIDAPKMKQKIFDEFSDLPVSRERKRQLRKNNMGLCSCGPCPDLVFMSGKCRFHYEIGLDYNRKEQGIRNPGKSICKYRIKLGQVEDPRFWNYSQTNRQIANQYGVSIETASNKRKKFAPHTMGHFRSNAAHKPEW